MEKKVYIRSSFWIEYKKRTWRYKKSRRTFLKEGDIIRIERTPAFGCVRISFLRQLKKRKKPQALLMGSRSYKAADYVDIQCPWSAHGGIVTFISVLLRSFLSPTLELINLKEEWGDDPFIELTIKRVRN